MKIFPSEGSKADAARSAGVINHEHERADARHDLPFRQAGVRATQIHAGDKRQVKCHVDGHHDQHERDQHIHAAKLHPRGQARRSHSQQIGCCRKPQTLQAQRLALLFGIGRARRDGRTIQRRAQRRLSRISNESRFNRVMSTVSHNTLAGAGRWRPDARNTSRREWPLPLPPFANAANPP